MRNALRLLSIWTYKGGIASHALSQTLIFFVMSLTATSIAIGSDSTLLLQVMPAILWVLMLLSSLLSLPNVFSDDLDPIILSKHPIPLLIFIKLGALTLISGLPLAILAPICLFLVDANQIYPSHFVFIGMILGALYFSSLGILAAALTHGARRTTAIYAAIIMPLAIPAIIFGTGGLSAIPLGLDNRPAFYLLAALTCGFVTLTPFAAAYILRMKVST